MMVLSGNNKDNDVTSRSGHRWRAVRKNHLTVINENEYMFFELRLSSQYEITRAKLFFSLDKVGV